MAKEVTKHKTPGFAKLLSEDPGLSGLRQEFARESASKRHRAAEWEYDASLADGLFAQAVALIPGGGVPKPKYPPDYHLPANNLKRLEQLRRAKDLKDRHQRSPDDVPHPAG